MHPSLRMFACIYIYAPEGKQYRKTSDFLQIEVLAVKVHFDVVFRWGTSERLPQSGGAAWAASRPGLRPPHLLDPYLSFSLPPTT